MQRPSDDEGAGVPGRGQGIGVPWKVWESYLNSGYLHPEAGGSEHPSPLVLLSSILDLVCSRLSHVTQRTAGVSMSAEAKWRGLRGATSPPGAAMLGQAA